MNAQNPEPSFFYRLTIIVLVLFFLLLALSSFTGVARNMEAVARYLPAWVAWTNLLLIPFLWAIAAGPSRISPPIRLSFFALAICSLLILEICFRRYVWPSTAALVLFLLEVYLIVPKWNSWRRRLSEP